MIAFLKCLNIFINIDKDHLLKKMNNKFLMLIFNIPSHLKKI